MKRGMLAVVIGLLVAANSAVSAEPIILTDIGSHWAKETVLKAVHTGYVDGYEDQSFRPDISVSRAEFITMLAKSLTLALGEEGEVWYSKYANAAVAAGVHRYEDFNQDINAPITRQEMMRLIVRSTHPDLTKPDISFSDKEFVYQATRTGLIQGLDRGVLGLGESTTRAQAVTVIDRVLRFNKRESLEVDKSATSYAEIELRGTNVTTMYRSYATPMPMKINIDSRLDAEIDKVIIVDMSDPNSAYYDWFSDVRSSSKQPLGNDYIVAAHLNVTNSGASGSGSFDLRQQLYYPNYWRGDMLSTSTSPSPVRSIKPIRFDTIGTTSGWVMGVVSKEYVQKGFDRIGACELILELSNAGGVFVLGDGVAN